MGDSQGPRLNLRPSDIYFSQEYISNQFEDGDLIGKRLDDLVKGKKVISDIRKIRVKQIHERWYTLDNRRLWVFRNFQKYKLTVQWYNDVTIPVLEWNNFETEDQLKFAATEKGKDVKILNDLDPGGKAYTWVDSIDSDTYNRPMVRFALDFGQFSYNATKTVVNLLWRGVRRVFKGSSNNNVVEEQYDSNV